MLWIDILILQIHWLLIIEIKVKIFLRIGGVWNVCFCQWRVVFMWEYEYLIWVWDVFSLGYFYGGWFLIHTKMVIGRGFPCMIGLMNHIGSCDCPWLLLSSFECGYSSTLAIMGTPTWWTGIGWFILEEFAPHA